MIPVDLLSLILIIIKKVRKKNDFANTDDLWKVEIDSLRKICAINEIDALVERSRSGRGAYLWIFLKMITKSRGIKQNIFIKKMWMESYKLHCQTVCM